MLPQGSGPRLTPLRRRMLCIAPVWRTIKTHPHSDTVACCLLTVVLPGFPGLRPVHISICDTDNLDFGTTRISAHPPRSSLLHVDLPERLPPQQLEAISLQRVSAGFVKPLAPRCLISGVLGRQNPFAHTRSESQLLALAGPMPSYVRTPN